MNRKHFLCLGAGMAAGCATSTVSHSPSEGGPKTSREVDAGPVGAYAADGVYASTESKGFYVVRRGPKLFALCALCTHRVCKLSVEPDHSFHCTCHGSTFDADGHVTEGPAVRDLPVYHTIVNPEGHLIVSVAT